MENSVNRKLTYREKYAVAIALYPNRRLDEHSPPAEIVVFNATDAETDAIDGGQYNLKNGLFTHFVLKGVQGQADTTRDGKINHRELFEYVRTEVTTLSNGAQVPTSYIPPRLADTTLIRMQ